MIADIDALVTSYERGALTRGQLLQSLALLATPAPAAAQGFILLVRSERVLRNTQDL